MKRVTQNLFEEIQKITSGSLEEKLKHDEDGDGDEDAADYMMKRRKAGGQSHAQAHAATRKHNEETEQEGEELEEAKKQPKYVTDKDNRKIEGGTGKGKLFKDGTRSDHESAAAYHDKEARMEAQRHNLEGVNRHEVKMKQHQDAAKVNETSEQLDEIGDTPAGKAALGRYVQKRAKQIPKIEVSYQMAPDEGGPFGAKRIKKFQKKVNKGVTGALNRLSGTDVTKKPAKNNEEVEHVEEAWPGTAEYKAKHGTDYEKHMMKYGGDPKAARATKGRYGYEGASGSETPETAADSSKVGRGRKKMKTEETIIKHDDFIISIQESYSFKDYLNAAKSYADNERDAITVAESFFKDEDTSLVLENEIKYLYQSVLDEYRKEGNEVTEMEIIIDGEDAEVSYTVTESDTITNYIHQGKIVRGEQ